MRTWLPGARPCGGTTKRALWRTICVPAARGVEVLMTILCWTVPGAEVVTLVVAGEMAVRVLLRASWEGDKEEVTSPLVPLWIFEG